MAGPSALEIRGTRQLKVVAARLQEAADGRLRREMLKGLRVAAGKALPSVRESASHTLPQRGGLADRVAAQKFAVRTRLAGANPSVRLAGTGMKELRDINAGRLRHPLFGNRDHWYQQRIEPGFFDRPIKREAPIVRKQIKFVMTDIARQIARRI